MREQRRLKWFSWKRHVCARVCALDFLRMHAGWKDAEKQKAFGLFKKRPGGLSSVSSILSLNCFRALGVWRESFTFHLLFSFFRYLACLVYTPFLNNTSSQGYLAFTFHQSHWLSWCGRLHVGFIWWDSVLFSFQHVHAGDFRDNRWNLGPTTSEQQINSQEHSAGVSDH